MGNCASPQYTTRKGGSLNWPRTAKVIHLDGRLQEFKQAIKAGYLLSLNPTCFLCSIESMYVDSHVPHMPEDEELQLGQIYFLLPLSKSSAPLSLQQLCALAIKANASLAHLDTNGTKFPNGPQGSCQIPVSNNIIGMNSPVKRGNPRICILSSIKLK